MDSFQGDREREKQRERERSQPLALYGMIAARHNNSPELAK